MPGIGNRQSGWLLWHAVNHVVEIVQDLDPDLLTTGHDLDTRPPRRAPADVVTGLACLWYTLTVDVFPTQGLETVWVGRQKLPQRA